MNFTQFEYPILLAAVVLLVVCTRHLTVRKIIVLSASFYFYAYWDYRFLGLLVASTLLDWSIGLGLAKLQNAAGRRGLLGLSIAGNLGVLGFFKYYNFFIESAQSIFDRWGLHPGTLSIVLPIGISFYTFQTLSYSIDVYRRNLAPCRSLLDFSLYVTFFPQLVAGPIVRASEFLPQLNLSPRVGASNFYPGLIQILRGFVKKLLIADHLAAMVDPVFATPDLYAAPTIWLAILAYAGQIYGDFSGYSDIAVGSARLLGFSLPKNFTHPYLASSIADFWRRWHITLSTWLRDYLYIPLGGNRLGELRTYANLMITMILGGLWHGAAWTFVAWGVWHGLALSIERLFATRNSGSQNPDSQNQATRMHRPASALRWLITFSIVMVGWMLFRSQSMAGFFALVQGLMNWNRGIVWLPPFPIAAIVLLTAEHAIWSTRFRCLTALEPDHWATPWLVGFMLAALAVFSTGRSQPFVYFQF